jgi:hypothetical protein
MSSDIGRPSAAAIRRMVPHDGFIFPCSKRESCEGATFALTGDVGLLEPALVADAPDGLTQGFLRRERSAHAWTLAR